MENPIKQVPTGRLLENILREDIKSITPISANIGEKDSGFNKRKKKFVL